MRRYPTLFTSIACVSLTVAVPAGGYVPDGEVERGLGLTKEQAVEVCQPKGEREYLERLRCPDGTPPSFERGGSVGSRSEPESEDESGLALDQMFRALKPGEKDFHMVDGYRVTCAGREVTLYLDMYHCTSEPPDEAPPGFTIVD